MSGKYTLIEVTRLTDLESRVRELETCCTIEAMLANPNVNSLITQHEKTIRELEAERDRLKHTAKELGDSFDRGIDREDALRIENIKLRARHSELEAERDRLKEEVERLKNVYIERSNELLSQRDELRTRNAELEALLSRCREMYQRDA